jgi:serine/threonine-protein kinase RsbW
MGRVIDTVVCAMYARSYPQKDRFAMRLALEEAIVNAIKHGHRHDPTQQVSVRYRVQLNRVLAEVEDQGRGFDPEQVPDPLSPENLARASGRGLLLMRSYMTSVRYNEQGNCVSLCKHRSPPEEA